MRGPAAKNRNSQTDLCTPLLLAVISLAWSLPRIGWGLPLADTAKHTSSLCPDEIGGIHAIVEVWKTIQHQDFGYLAYPLFQYMVIDVFYLPYLLFKLLTGGFSHPRPVYPFGFAHPQESIQMLWLISRAVSTVMGVGTILIAYKIGSELWDRAAGRVFALLAMLAYPFSYYAKMSNLDVPALFWVSLVLLLFVRVQKEGLSHARAVWLGVFSSFAVATKDQSYAVVVMLGAAVLVSHFRALPAKGNHEPGRHWRAPLTGLFSFISVYLIASGFLFWPERFFRHVSYIRFGSMSGHHYFAFPPTPAGYGALLLQCWQYLVQMLGWPILTVALIGILACFLNEKANLVFLLPIFGTILLVFVPVRYVALRFLLPSGFLLSLYAARGVLVCWRSPRPAFRVVGGILAGVGCALSLAKGADLTLLMFNDPRLAASAWFAQNARAGDRVEFFGPEGKAIALLVFPDGVVISRSNVTEKQGSGSLQGDFDLLMGEPGLSSFWNCPRWVHDALEDGSLQYDRVAEFHTQTLFPLDPHFDFLDPDIHVYARRDRTPQGGRAPVTSRDP